MDAYLEKRIIDVIEEYRERVKSPENSIINSISLWTDIYILVKNHFVKEDINELYKINNIFYKYDKIFGLCVKHYPDCDNCPLFKLRGEKCGEDSLWDVVTDCFSYNRIFDIPFTEWKKECMETIDIIIENLWHCYEV